MKRFAKSRKGKVDYKLGQSSAENLIMGYLLRRNILAYKAPPNNRGYDIICVHPDPKRATKRSVRIQVKSRYQIDCNRAVPIRRDALGAFDYLVAVFLNIGYFYGSKPKPTDPRHLEFYTLPRNWVRNHHQKVPSGFDKVVVPEDGIDRFKNEAGLEQIARKLQH
ncbi:MAG TPA: hypothetical protein VNN18_11970 [Candidatus Xenobia bacterium]|nr:hypothetical protein [Candidatus Xenobia bacterium]